MTLSEFKLHLEKVENLTFLLPNGTQVPSHFHITEVGLTTKQFTDCGNTFRTSKKATFQLWTSIDFYHRLEPQKIIKIINSTEHIFVGEEVEVEIEFQQETVGKFGLDFVNGQFYLTNTKTDCLAKESCGFPTEKIKKSLKEMTSCCTPDSGCC